MQSFLGTVAISSLLPIVFLSVESGSLGGGSLLSVTSSVVFLGRSHLVAVMPLVVSW